MLAFTVGVLTLALAFTVGVITLMNAVTVFESRVAAVAALVINVPFDASIELSALNFHAPVIMPSSNVPPEFNPLENTVENLALAAPKLIAPSLPGSSLLLAARINFPTRLADDILLPALNSLA